MIVKILARIAAVMYAANLALKIWEKRVSNRMKSRYPSTVFHPPDYQEPDFGLMFLGDGGQETAEGLSASALGFFCHSKPPPRYPLYRVAQH